MKSKGKLIVFCVLKIFTKLCFETELTANIKYQAIQFIIKITERITNANHASIWNVENSQNLFELTTQYTEKTMFF